MSEPAPALEARSVTKHFPVHQTGRALLRQGSVVHAVDGVSLTVPRRRHSRDRRRERLRQVHAGPAAGPGADAHVGRGADARRSRDRRVPAGLRAHRADGACRTRSPRSTRRTRSAITWAARWRCTGPRTTLSRDAAIEQLLDRVALSPAKEFAAKFPHELSGGQRQRVAIARALAARPKILIADEPVSMLDVSIRLGVLNLLAGLRDDERLAIAYVTHDIASARYLADEVAVMYAGTLVETGPAIERDRFTASSLHPAPARGGARS